MIPAMVKFFDENPTGVFKTDEINAALERTKPADVLNSLFEGVRLGQIFRHVRRGEGGRYDLYSKQQTVTGSGE